MTGVSRLGSATGSGLNNYDYQSIANLSSSHTPLHQLQTVNKVPIPPEILEHFKRRSLSICKHRICEIYEIFYNYRC